MAKGPVHLWVAMVALVCLGGVAQADFVVDVQFGTAQTAPQVGPAMIGAAGDQWNLLTARSGTTVPLNNTSGGASGITLTWTSGTSGGTYSPPHGFDPERENVFRVTAYRNLMDGYLYNPSGSANISFSGLTPFAAYGLYIYTEGDYSSTGRMLSVIVNSGLPTSTIAADSTASTFILGQNYLNLSGVTALYSSCLVMRITASQSFKALSRSCSIL